MDPTRGDSRYNLNYSMSSIGLALADQTDIYGNPTSVAVLSGRPPSVGLLQTMSGGLGGGGGGVTGGANSSISIGLVPRNSAGLMPTAAQCQAIANNVAIGQHQQQQQQQHQQHQQQQQQQQQHQQQRGLKRAGSDCYEDHHRSSGGGSGSSSGAGTGAGLSSLQALENCSAPVQQQQQQSSSRQQQQQQSGGSIAGGCSATLTSTDLTDDIYNPLQSKKSPPANGKKTKGRVKIKMEYIDNKLRRYTTFSKRKTGIMKKAYELSTLTGTQVMLLVASETGHVYTFATRKLQPMITSEAGKQLIQTCLNSPDPPTSVGSGDQRMSATGFEETELSYNIADEDSKDVRSPLSCSGNESDESSEFECQIENEKVLTNTTNNLKQQITVAETTTSTTTKTTLTTTTTEVTDTNDLLDACQLNTNSNSNNNNDSQMRLHQTINKEALKSLETNKTSCSSDEQNKTSMDYKENVPYSSSPSLLSNVPQDVLLQLIQSGHLQVYTEEDGSGHQYVAVPLSPTTMNLLQTLKPSNDQLTEKQHKLLKCTHDEQNIIEPKRQPIMPAEITIVKRKGE